MGSLINNHTTKIKICLILIILLVIMGQATGMAMNSNKKYDYQVGESAPSNLPMQIISGSLIFEDNKGSLYVPNMVIVANGWGEWRSSHVLDNDGYPLPEKLKLTFYSYTENKFYQDEFDLPLEKLSDLFSKGFYSFNQDDDITFDRFIIGTAPGGIVTVWISAYDRRIEVFQGKAKEIDGDWKWVVDNPEVSRMEYINEVIDYEQRTAESKKDFKENGIPFGRWEKYHNSRYYWQPVLTDMNLRDGIIKYISFYNGEKDYLNLPLENYHKDLAIAIPDKLSIIWNRTGYLINDLSIEVFFDEKEIFNAFETIEKDKLPIEMELRMEPEKNYDFTIWLRNAKNSIELKKTKIKTWKPGGMRYENAGPKDTE